MAPKQSTLHAARRCSSTTVRAVPEVALALALALITACKSERTSTSAPAPATVTAETAPQAGGELPPDDRGFVDTRQGWGWSDRCWKSLGAGSLGQARAECTAGLKLAQAPNGARPSLLYNLGSHRGTRRQRRWCQALLPTIARAPAERGGERSSTPRERRASGCVDRCVENRGR